MTLGWLEREWACYQSLLDEMCQHCDDRQNSLIGYTGNGLSDTQDID